MKFGCAQPRRNANNDNASSLRLRSEDIRRVTYGMPDSGLILAVSSPFTANFTVSFLDHAQRRGNHHSFLKVPILAS